MSKEINIAFENRDQHIAVGLNIAYYRKRVGLNQLQLAEKANVSRSFISAIEAPNMVTNITLETLFCVAKALGVPPAKLLDFRD